MNEPRVTEPSRLTYLKTLPDDICVKLIEWLNLVWYEESDYEEYLCTGRLNGGSSLLCLLLSEDGLFCDVISSLVTRVTLSLIRDSTNISFKYREITIGPELFENEEMDEGLAQRLLKVCGESTKEIVFDVRSYDALHREDDGNRVIQQFVSLVIQYCPAVDSLEFISGFHSNNIASKLLAKLSPQLRSIVWFRYECGNNIHLPDFTNCTQIRNLSLTATPQVTSLLACAGSSLESLCLTFDTFERYGEVLGAIEQNCKKLLHVSLFDSRSIITSVG